MKTVRINQLNPDVMKHLFTLNARWITGTMGLCMFALFTFSAAKAQLIVSNSAPYNSVNYLVQNVLLGAGVQISNVTYTGVPNAIGFFNGVNANLNLDSGIVLTTGDIFTAVGPNTKTSASVDNGITFNDPDLMGIEPTAFYDACILEFDFISNSDSVFFKYVFASEEYPEFVGSPYNDAFGFFLKGVTVNMPVKNIAMVPSTTTPIAINNVNNGGSIYGPSCPSTPTSGPCTNCAYYVDNCTGATVEYDGFTTMLTAIAAPLIPGQTYHIKMAVADASDNYYDAGVFLKACSFSSSAKSSSNPCSPPVGIEQTTTSSPTLMLYPVPAQDKITLSWSHALNGSVQIRIMNLMGETLYAGNFFSIASKTISLSGFPGGMYFVKVDTEQESITEKIIIHK